MLHGNRCPGGILTGLLLGAVLQAAVCFFAPEAAEARFWFAGTVTSAADQAQGKIEVNGIRFTLMPRAKVEQEYEVSTGEFQKRQVSLNRIVVGSKVRMLIEGHRIHQLVLDR